MAVVRTSKNSVVTMNVRTGLKEDGTAILSARNLTHINPAISDDAMLEAAEAIAGLVEYPCEEIKRTDTAVLVKEA